MNKLDDLLDSTREVGEFSHAGFERGRNVLNDAVRSARPQRRVPVVALASGAVVAAAAVAVVVAVTSTGSASAPTTTASSNHTITTSAPTAIGTEDSNSIQLVGYRIALPADYKVGKVDANCTKDLHLTADETKKAVTVPNADCPLVISSVVKEVPAEAVKQVTPPMSKIDAQGKPVDPDSNLTLTFYTMKNPTDSKWLYTYYMPVQLSDSSTVYVTLDLSATSGELASSATGGVLGGEVIYQLAQLEHGLQVEKTPTS